VEFKKKFVMDLDQHVPIPVARLTGENSLIIAS